MEWLSGLGLALDYVEEHLTDENLNAAVVAKEAAVSSFYFQKGFSILTGIGIGEYIRNRRLYAAALEISAGAKVIDVALKYCWETPESFSKAFSRFHGTTPQSIKGNPGGIKVFLPFKISVSVSGGEKINCRIERKKAFKVVGFKRTIAVQDCQEKIPEFWTEIYEKNGSSLRSMGFGEYGICLDENVGKGSMDYVCAGAYKGGRIPDGMSVVEIPAMQWAVFESYGPIPGALQAVNGEIFRSWLPSNGRYEIAANYNVEWYSDGNMEDAEYRAEIWIPVKEMGR